MRMRIGFSEERLDKRATIDESTFVFGTPALDMVRRIVGPEPRRNGLTRLCYPTVDHLMDLSLPVVAVTHRR